jgi:hypothetical protein
MVRLTIALKLIASVGGAPFDRLSAHAFSQGECLSQSDPTTL